MTRASAIVDELVEGIREVLIDPDVSEMKAYLKNLFGAKANDSDMDKAIYTFASKWHAGKITNLYKVYSTSKHTDMPEYGSLAYEMWST